MENRSTKVKCEYEAFIKYYFFKRSLTINRISIILLVAIYFGASMALNNQNKVFHLGLFFNGFLISVSVLYFFMFIVPYVTVRKTFVKQTEANLFGNQQFSTTADGISLKENTVDLFINWESIKTCGTGGGYIYFVLFSKQIYLIRLSAFTSENEANNYLGIISNGILKVRGVVKPKDGRRIYKWGFLDSFQMLRLVAGIIFIIRGLFQYKDKWLVLIGIGGILFTIGFWYAIDRSSIFEEQNVATSKTFLNSLAKNIEFYKLQNGVFPDSIEQISKTDKMVFVYDPLNSNTGENLGKFNYHRLAGGYTLYSSGLDRIPNTKDDIYPDSTYMDTTKKFGLIRH